MDKRKRIRKSKPKAGVPELCEAVRKLRIAAHWSQEDMSRITNIAAQTISRFELGKQVPKDVGVLMRLRDAANSAHLPAEAIPFERALMGGYTTWPMGDPSIRPSAPYPVLPHTPEQFRLGQIAGIVALHAPKVAAAMEKAAEAFPLAKEVVDEVIHEWLTESNLTDARTYSWMEQEIRGRVFRKVFERIKREAVESERHQKENK
jgi:transcriptional regulator with XRE-family HTH domain